VHWISFVYESAQGFCLAGILVGARVPASFDAVAAIAAGPVVVTFTPSVNFSEVPFRSDHFFNGSL
jgi:hypothetical protein